MKEGIKTQSQYRTYALLGARMIELLSIASFILGSMWATTDIMIVTVLVKSPINSLSVFMMLYGLVGTLITEVLARRWRSNEPAKN